MVQNDCNDASMNTVTSAKRVLPQASCYDRLKLYAALPRQGSDGAFSLWIVSIDTADLRKAAAARPSSLKSCRIPVSPRHQTFPRFQRPQPQRSYGMVDLQIVGVDWSPCGGNRNREPGRLLFAAFVIVLLANVVAAVWGWRGRFGPRARSGFVTGVSLGAALIAPRRRSSRLTHFYAASFNLR